MTEEFFLGAGILFAQAPVCGWCGLTSLSPGHYSDEDNSFVHCEDHEWVEDVQWAGDVDAFCDLCGVNDE